jgi:hypothetical protein
MVDFPTGLPDIPAAVPGAPLATLHSGTSQSAAMNRIQANLAALATKLGTGAATPTTGRMLAGAATGGQSTWVDHFDGPTLLVAAADAAASTRAVANYVCDGAGDEVEIQAALAALPAAGGTVRLSEGTFALAGVLATSKANTHLAGSGMDATILLVASAAGAVVNSVLIGLAHASCSVRDLTVDGNKANNAAQTSMFGVRAGSTDGIIERVKVKNSAGTGFVAGVGSTGTRIAACIAETNAASGYLLRAASEAGVTLVDGCVARSNVGVGFACDFGPVMALGCLSLSNAGGGYSVTATGVAHLLACDAALNSGSGFYSEAPDTEIVGCQAYQNGAHGILVTGTGARVMHSMAIRNGSHGIMSQSGGGQIVGNRVNDNGSATDQGYWGITLDNASGVDQLVDQNMARQGTAFANRQYGGLGLTSTPGNCLIGTNDLYASGAAVQFFDGATNTRRAAKLQLNYVASTDVMNGTSVGFNTWQSIMATQTFRVDSPTSLVAIAVRGHAMVQGTTDGEHHGSRILIDSATQYRLGGGIYFSGKSFINPLIGAGVVVIAGLATGNHTLDVQIIRGGATNGIGYLRAASIPEYEHLAIQVTEYQR